MKKGRRGGAGRERRQGNRKVGTGSGDEGREGLSGGFCVSDPIICKSGHPSITTSNTIASFRLTTIYIYIYE